MFRYKISIEYDGTNLVGWQRQLDGDSVQEFLENAIISFAEKSEQRLYQKELMVWQAKNLNRTLAENINQPTERKSAAYYDVREHLSTGDVPEIPLKQGFVFGAGRTDAGVHALGQVAHFDLRKKWNEFHLREAINAQLRDAGAPVSVLDVAIVPNDFHARFSARGRGYVYKILNRPAPPIIDRNRVWWVSFPLDLAKMRQAASYLLGHHDFSSFRAAACQALSPIKTLDRLDIEVIGEEVIFTVEARSFLHHQVRNMVGTLKLVGGGYLQPEDILEILKKKDRKAAGPTAPACGLYLNKVVY